MKIVIIGSGNVATVLGRRAVQNGHEVLCVISRDQGHATSLAAALGCAYGGLNTPPDPAADLVLMAVSDKALHELSDLYRLSGQLVVHTAGSVPMSILAAVSPHHGVLYPLQSIRKVMDEAVQVPLLVDAGTESDRVRLYEFALSLSPVVHYAGDGERLKLHVAAVFVCNFANHLYALAEQFCQQENISFGLLYPLLLETATRIQGDSPARMKTGPAVRNDLATIKSHLATLEKYPGMQEVYRLLTNSILASEGFLDRV